MSLLHFAAKDIIPSLLILFGSEQNITSLSHKVSLKMAQYLDSFLASLPSTTKSYPYKGLEDLWSHVEERQREEGPAEMRGGYALFTGVDESSFHYDFELSESKSTSRLLDSYFPQSQILLVAMGMTGEHEMGHMNLASALLVKLSGMGGANLALKFTATKEYQTPTRTKRADQSFKPIDLPQDRSGFWPSLVMESGWSESKSKLQDDASWFLTESAGDVKVALTISIHQTMPEIVINKWEPEAAPTSTRSRVRPILAQQIVISKNKGQPTSTAIIEGATLVISFEDLFLRPPGRGEGNIEFTHKDLRDIAYPIWHEQNI